MQDIVARTPDEDRLTDMLANVARYCANTIPTGVAMWTDLNQWDSGVSISSRHFQRFSIETASDTIDHVPSGTADLPGEKKLAICVLLHLPQAGYALVDYMVENGYVSDATLERERCLLLIDDIVRRQQEIQQTMRGVTGKVIAEHVEREMNALRRQIAEGVVPSAIL